MAIRINANGTRVQVAPARGPAFTLEELQGVVGGYIEAFYLFDGRIMFINEDGKRFELTPNLEATRVARANGLPPDDYIVGDAIVMTRLEAGGGDEDLEEQEPRVTCPRCGAVSYNANDIAQRYCGRCHRFHNERSPG